MSPERKSNVLVVDDEPQLRRMLNLSLDEAGYSVREAGEGRVALGEIAIHAPDAIILDLGLPDISGLEVLHALRAMCDAPVLILSVGADEESKVSALNEGADDYLTKPFGRRELLARVGALLRRTASAQSDQIVHLGSIDVDLSLKWVSRDGMQVKLTGTEYQLLELLVLELDRVVTHRRILRELWGAKAEDKIHYVRTYMTRLRTKLGSEFIEAGYLQSESGVGYRLVSEPKLRTRPSPFKAA